MKNKEKDDLHELDLTTETTLLLRTAGIKTIEALVKKTPQELLKVKRIGAQHQRDLLAVPVQCAENTANSICLKRKKENIKGL